MITHSAAGENRVSLLRRITLTLAKSRETYVAVCPSLLNPDAPPSSGGGLCHQLLSIVVVTASAVLRRHSFPLSLSVKALLIPTPLVTESDHYRRHRQFI